MFVIGTTGPVFRALDTNVRTDPGEVLAEGDNSITVITFFVAVLTVVRNYPASRVN